jgi:carbonic anhydrase
VCLKFDARERHSCEEALNHPFIAKACEANVFEQVCNLAKTSIVQAAWERRADLHLHGWVYDVADGLIKDLDVTLINNSTLQNVYKLDI